MSTPVNPYSAPDTPPDSSRQNCPVCETHVGYLRFALPFGGCQSCGNYLTIRNWQHQSWLRWVAQLLILAGLIFSEWIDIDFDEVPVLTLLLVYLCGLHAYDIAVGRLVPAVWWGIFALEDDDRLRPSSDDSQRTK